MTIIVNSNINQNQDIGNLAIEKVIFTNTILDETVTVLPIQNSKFENETIESNIPGILPIRNMSGNCILYNIRK